MSFIEHSVLWAKGEIFEGIVIALVGLALVIVSIAFWKFGHTPGSKSMILPILVCGALFLAIGTSMTYSNNKRVEIFRSSHAANPVEFAISEKKRVEDFQYLYKVTLWGAAVFFLVSIALQWFFSYPNLRAIGIVLAFIGILGLTIDFFSKERADIYYQKIKNEIKMQNADSGQ